MSDYRVTFSGEIIGRIDVPDEVAKTLCNAMVSGGRFELSAAFEKNDAKPRLVEFVLSPMVMPKAQEVADE